MISIAFLPCWRSGRKQLTPKRFLAVFWLISQKHLIVSHDCILAKLNAYGFSLPTLNLIQNYLANRKRRTKINDSYSPWSDILFGVPQGSILGSLLFQYIFKYSVHLLLIVKDVNIASHANGILYDWCDNIEEIIWSLQSSSKKFFQWLSDNQIKSIIEKCHLIMSTQFSTWWLSYTKKWLWENDNG